MYWPDAYVSITDSQNEVKHAFDRTDLEACADGGLFGKGNAQLPTSPLLMLDRITDIQSEGGDFGNGYAIAEFDITPDSWFFAHHFEGDPIMPGIFLVESIWQLIGFHLAWLGNSGKGRVLDGGRTRFSEPVYAVKQSLQVQVQIKKVILKPYPINIANGITAIDGKIKCRCDAVKVVLR